MLAENDEITLLYPVVPRTFLLWDRTTLVQIFAWMHMIGSNATYNL